MATSKDFKDFVLESLEKIVQDSSNHNVGFLRFSARKMFGEYCVYIHGGEWEQSELNIAQARAIFLICNNTLFLKQHKVLEQPLLHIPKAKPFHGAREWYMLDIESRELIEEILIIIPPFLKPIKHKKHIKSKFNKT